MRRCIPLIKIPAIDTLRAWGADKENSVFCTTDFFLNIAAIFHPLFVLACPFPLNHPPPAPGLSSTGIISTAFTSTYFSWKGKIKCCAVVDLSFSPHMSTVSLNDALDNGKPNAGFFKLVDGMVSLKDSKQLAGILHIKSDTIVFNIIDILIRSTAPNPDF